MINFDLIFQWILPLSIALMSYYGVMHFFRRVYEYADLDKLWSFLIKAGLIAGAITLILYCVITAPWYEQAKYLLFSSSNKVQQTVIWQTLLNYIKIGLIWLLYWLAIYLRSILIVWLPCFYITIQSLIWRISFNRTANIIVQLIILSPWLMLKYLFGYQTPFFDFFQKKLFLAKLKENLNDSYFDALSGYDDRGNKFENGVGGTVQTQRIKKTALAIRQSRVVVKTMDGLRYAEIFVRKSRETDTDRLIAEVLKGLGSRLTAPSIRFPEDATFSADKGGFLFDSSVPYNAADELGLWKDNFSNPFAASNKIKNKGKGFLGTYLTNCLNMLRYFRHLTPAAFLEKMQAKDAKRFYRDPTLDRSKYLVEHNLDLSVIKTPVDPETGATIEQQKQLAYKKAMQLEPDLNQVLNSFKINGTFDNVMVGGNTAVYSYTLPRSPHLPTNFDNLAKGISNMLKMPDIPIVLVSAGVLKISLVTGVNIPVDFREMIKKRPSGVSEVISGLIGVDAMGKPIEFSLGNQIPHMILFGKTGSGKTVTLMNMIYSVMDSKNPEEVKIIYIDGKGNSFELMRTDNPENPDYHPNPYTYAQPAGAGDIQYVRALFNHVVKLTQDRIELFKKFNISKIEEYNKRFPDKKLCTILVICDELSTIIDQDAQLKSSEAAENNVTDKIEYLAKMSRSVGIRLILANQTARKEKIPGRITANISGRVSLGVTEPVESDIALPDTGIKAHYITQAGEFYSLMKGTNHPEHGNSPFLEDEEMYDLNDKLEEKFGHHDYVYTRQEIIDEFRKSKGEEGDNDMYVVPNNLPNQNSSVQDLLAAIKNNPQWAVVNRKSPIFTENKDLHAGTKREVHHKEKLINEAFEQAQDFINAKKAEEVLDARKHSGKFLARGKDKGVI